VKTREERNSVIFTYKPINKYINEKVSSSELSIDMVIDTGIFKNNQITLFPYFTFIPEKRLGIPTTWKSICRAMPKKNLG